MTPNGNRPASEADQPDCEQNKPLPSVRFLNSYEIITELIKA
jgi:hypothetical protein